MNKIILYILVPVLFAMSFSNETFAQKKVRQEVRKGNKAYKKENYTDAEVAYRKALTITPTDSTAMYNLAATLLQTKRGEEAFDLYKKLTEVVQKRGNASADVHHNLGVMLMAQKKYAEAIELYKESLRARPTDNETRYNLILAQKLLQQENKGGESQDKNDQQQEDKKEQEKNQNNKEKPNEDPQDNDKKDRAQEQPSNAQEKMSKDNAEKILKAFLEDEKKTQEKVNKAQSQQTNRKRADKNW
ncbi:MAG: tetratricopeptide repeat protein [Porphyromonas sp.]|nr:tetratricopeptide repeat protein [Porphyromonas sp.]